MGAGVEAEVETDTTEIEPTADPEAGAGVEAAIEAGPETELTGVEVEMNTRG